MKMKLFAIIFILSFTQLYTQWVNDNYFYNKRFSEVFVIDSNNILAWGPYKIKYPKFYKTIDGGDSWAQMLSDSLMYLKPEVRGDSLIVRHLCRGYDNSIWMSNIFGYFFNTLDTGRTWNRIKSSIGYNEMQYFQMFDKQYGLLSDGNLLLLTVDGCMNFYTCKLYNSELSGNILITDYCITENKEIICAVFSQNYKKTFLVRSTDWGKSWQLDKNQNLGKSIIKFYRFNDGIYFYTREDISVNKKVISTYNVYKLQPIYDDSLLIFTINTESFTSIKYIHFLNSLNGIISLEGGKYFMTDDGGINWYDKGYFTNSNFISCWVSPTKAFAFTENGYIYKYEKTTDIIENPIIFDNIRIFPNPISSGSKLQIQGIDFIEEVNLYDLSGISTKLDVNGSEIKIPNGISPGFYILQYRAVGNVYREKIIVCE